MICYEVWFKDAETDKKTGGSAETVKIFIGSDHGEQDQKWD